MCMLIILNGCEILSDILFAHSITFEDSSNWLLIHEFINCANSFVESLCDLFGKMLVQINGCFLCKVLLSSM